MVMLGLAVAIVIISLFYRVREIQVVNGTDYADGQIVGASGIEVGDNLFFINRFQAASMIFSDLPYVEAVTIEQEAPSKIILHVQGRSAIGYVELDNELWLLDRRGTVLEKITPETAEEFVCIRAVTPISPVPGELMVSDEAGMARLQYALEILDCLTAEKLIGKVEYIDMKDVSDPHLVYDGRLNVYLGANEEVAYKFALFADVVQKLSGSDRGTLRYAGGTSWTFSPD
jgi:cell division protein FtsQ